MDILGYQPYSINVCFGGRSFLGTSRDPPGNRQESPSLRPNKRDEWSPTWPPGWTHGPLEAMGAKLGEKDDVDPESYVECI